MQPEPAVVLPWHPREPRKLSAADWERFEGYVEEIFTAFGLEPETPGTRETPERGATRSTWRRPRRGA